MKLFLVYLMITTKFLFNHQGMVAVLPQRMWWMWTAGKQGIVHLNDKTHFM